MSEDHSETLDSIRDIKLYQAKDGYRFSIDALLLEHFISIKRPGRGIELGTGSGVISILLAKRLKSVNIVAVEIQKSLAERAKRNVTLNGLDEKIEILNIDIKKLKDLYPSNSFSFAFSNPPFRRPDTGRISINDERAIARHEIKMRLEDLIEIAAFLLKNSGKFFLIYHPFRLAELIDKLREKRLEPKRMRFVHSRQGEEARMVLVEAVKGSGVWLKIEPPVFVYDIDGNYTEEMIRIMY
jgi:tRNA1Val (adenine37-N6)-methyltransferase